MAPQAEVRRVKSCAAQQEGGEVSNLFSWQSGRGKDVRADPQHTGRTTGKLAVKHFGIQSIIDGTCW